MQNYKTHLVRVIDIRIRVPPELNGYYTCLFESMWPAVRVQHVALSLLHGGKVRIYNSTKFDFGTYNYHRPLF